MAPSFRKLANASETGNLKVVARSCPCYSGSRSREMDVRWIQRATYLVIVVFILYLNYRIFEPFFAAIAWAAVLAIFFFPGHKRIFQRVRRPNAAAAISLLIVLVLLVGPAVTIGAACVQQGIALSRSARTQEMIPKIQDYIDRIRDTASIPLPDLNGKLLDAAQTAGRFLARHSAAVAGDAAQFVMNLGITLVVLFFLFRDGPRIVAFLRDTAPMEREISGRVFGEISTMVTVTLQSTVIVAIAQGAVAGLVYWILGLPAPIFLAVASAVLAFLPLIGPAIIWGAAAILLALSGEYWRAVAMVVLGNVGISGVDNILRPMLISGRAQLNALLSILSVLGGIYAFGFLGMVLGPLVVAITIGMLKGYRESLQSPGNTPEASTP